MSPEPRSPWPAAAPSGSVLARVMHQQNREAKLPLQRAEIPQQLGHFARMILVDAVKSHQGIQHQQPRPKPPGRLPEPRAVPIVIEPEHRGGDHVDLHLVRDPDHDAGPFPRCAHAQPAARPRPGRPGPVPAPARRTCPGTPCPWLRERAMSSPSQVLAHLGAPPITPTDVGAPELVPPANAPRSPGSAISPTRTTGSTCSTAHRHRHTFTFFFSAGRVFLG